MCFVYYSNHMQRFSLLCFEESSVTFIAVFFVLKSLWGSVETVISVNLILFFEVIWRKHVVEECQMLSWVMLWQKKSCYIKSLCHFLWNTHSWLIHLTWSLDSNTEMALTFSMVKKTLWPEPVSADGATWVYIPSENPVAVFLMPSHCLSKICKLYHETVYLLLRFFPYSLAFWQTACFLLVSFRCKCYFLLSPPVPYPAFLLPRFG